MKSGSKVFAKHDAPVLTRVCKALLYTGRNVLIEQNFEKDGLWVHHESDSLICGEGKIFTVISTEGDVNVAFESGWREYFVGQGKWDTAYRKAIEKFKKVVEKFKKVGRKATKGLGKGKREE